MSSDSAKTVFLNALEIASPKERDEYLSAQCGNDQSLRGEVEDLLRHHEQIAPVGESPSAGRSTSTLAERLGTMIGPYKLLQQIGEGGMGVVYMAEQSEPVERRVALKIIKPGMDTRQVIARFEAERQALAMMDHPNIAKVFDAGTTDSSRSFFVMELVRGVPITKYCDEHQLTLKQRLELFLPVCQAIQHAHQKGIIHRDLKPNNVLVAQYDDKPVPKIIDFGVAKAAQKLTERTMFTEFGQVVGTLEYMSPEQAQLNQLDIDTRSDIYSLGVLLYELLTGCTPFDGQRLRNAAFDEMLRIIREEEPLKPSTRLSSVDTLPSIAASRGVEPARLAHTIRGDLDWIVMKALEKDRNRRYETASGLAQDLQRYLTDEPVQACPPSAAYRLRKFFRRNRGALIATAAVVAALIAGTLTSTALAIRAINAERLAETRLRSETEAHAETLEARIEATAAWRQAEVSHDRAQSNLVKAREAVHLMTQIAQERLENMPHLEQVRVELLETALRLHLEFLKQQGDDLESRREAALAYGRAGEVHAFLGNRTKGNELLREAVARLEQIVAEAAATAADRAALVHLYNGFSVYGTVPREEVVSKLRRAIELSDELVQQDPNNLHYKHELARSYGSLGRKLVNREPAEAEKLILYSLQLAEQIPDQVAIASACMNMGDLRMRQDNPESEKWIRRALVIWQEQGAHSGWHRFDREMVARSLCELGYFFSSKGNTEDAIDAFQRSADLWTELLRDYPTNLENQKQLTHNNLGLLKALSAIEDTSQWRTAYQKIIDRSPGDRRLLNGLAWLFANCPNEKIRDPLRAIELARKATELDPKSVSYLNTLGVAYYRAGDWRAAIECLRQSVDRNPSSGTPYDFLFLAMAYWRLSDKGEARKWHGRALEWFEKEQSQNDELKRFRMEAETLMGLNQSESGVPP